MVLHMYLYDRNLDQNLCDALSKTMKTGTDFAKSEDIVAGMKFHIHKWIVPVSDAEKANRAIGKFNLDHGPNVALYLHAMEQSVSQSLAPRVEAEDLFHAIKNFRPSGWRQWLAVVGTPAAILISAVITALF